VLHDLSDVNDCTRREKSNERKRQEITEAMTQAEQRKQRKRNRTKASREISQLNTYWAAVV
jgi:hypothetical protein